MESYQEEVRQVEGKLQQHNTPYTRELFNFRNDPLSHQIFNNVDLRTMLKADVRAFMAESVSLSWTDMRDEIMAEGRQVT